MSEHYTVRLESKHVETVEEATEVGIGDNDTESIRALLDAGAVHYGLNGHDTGDTRLRQAVRRAGDALGVVAVILLGASVFAPNDVRVPFVLVPLVSSLSMYGLDRVLGRHEPRVSAWLSRGGKA